MSENTIRVGINGFGRIGRSIARILVDDIRFDLVVVNDIAEDVFNLAYLYNYDSVYGRAIHWADSVPGEDTMTINDMPVKCYCERNIVDVPWEEHNVDVIIESSGVASNVNVCRDITNKERVKKVVVTHSPKAGVDNYFVMGVNDENYNHQTDNVVSSSICDVNAVSHILKAMDKGFGIKRGWVTTLHPWLSYQNLVDAPLASQSNPGHFWKDYSLGRASTDALIPKNTTVVPALKNILPDIASRMSAFSFRIPTAIVSCADMTIELNEKTTSADITSFLFKEFSGSKYVGVGMESLTSVDYIGDSRSTILDAQWVNMLDGNMVKLISWYDNEWGYSSRVVDLVYKIHNGGKQEQSSAAVDMLEMSEEEKVAALLQGQGMGGGDADGESAE
jgi:glyceraldehyde 3-phosphate dehydrogenase